ncbi:MAG TPA: cold shock domain-containing protein [Humidesulfovibrio sp.]|uniref:cold shock domain-containing protein n=1 Tax=Humidesulfovibrio sp. TaxID=2910988 RepID=UPI002CA0289C|nr:cold shock domain-containing protein [Humidesulfovibrio sp.]HWR03294.1 cold shock domain-containing protein [Humidesulfovibrio sp.]
MRIRGTVKKFSDFRGFGFIQGEDGVEYFVHINQIAMEGYRTLDRGQLVEFAPVSTEKGWQAYELELAGDVHRSPDVPIGSLDNPFLPQKPMIDPRKFAGRNQETGTALRSLHNQMNILVAGPRGIGKSSFARQITLINEGNKSLLERIGVEAKAFNNTFVTCDYCCQPNDSLHDIVNNLITILSYKVVGAVPTTEKQVSQSHNIGDSSITVSTTERHYSGSELASTFRIKVSEIFKNVDTVRNGITFFIDEIDTLDASVDIATFIKTVTEALQASAEFKFVFVLCGVAGAYTNLLSQHPSFARLFEQITLTQFKNSEIHDMLTLSLQDSGYAISPDAAALICTLSNRFPHPVHQLGFYSFCFAENKHISIKDVEEAKKYITTRLKAQEFHNRLSAETTSPSFQLLQAMAHIDHDLVSIGDLERRLPDFDTQKILGTFGRLMQREFIDRDGNKYRFREPLFKIYIRWAFPKQSSHR